MIFANQSLWNLMDWWESAGKTFSSLLILYALLRNKTVHLLLVLFLWDAVFVNFNGTVGSETQWHTSMWAIEKWGECDSSHTDNIRRPCWYLCFFLCRSWFFWFPQHFLMELNYAIKKIIHFKRKKKQCLPSCLLFSVGLLKPCN